MDRNLNEQESIDVLNCILVGYEHLECLDRIENTFYRHEVKMRVRALKLVLERIAPDGLEQVAGIDNVALFNLMEHKKQLMKKIATLRPEHKSGFNALLDEYLKNPEQLLSKLEIEIIDRDK